METTTKTTETTTTVVTPDVAPAAIATAAANGKGTKTALPATLDPLEVRLQDDKSKNLYNIRLQGMLESPKWPGFLASVRRFGVQTPIIVRRDGDTFELLAGHRRTIAARLVNEELVAAGAKTLIRLPYTVRRTSDKDGMLVGALENAQREDNTPLQQAYLAQKLLELGATDEDAALALGVSEIYLKAHLLKLLETDDSIQADVEAGVIPAAAAVPLAGLPREEQRAIVAEEKAKAKAKGGKVKGKDIKAAAAVAKKKRGAQGPRKTNASTVAARPGIKEMQQAFVGALAWAAEPGLLKGKESKEQAVAELLGAVTGEGGRELFDFLVGLGSRRNG